MTSSKQCINQHLLEPVKGLGFTLRGVISDGQETICLVAARCYQVCLTRVVSLTACAMLGH